MTKEEIYKELGYRGEYTKEVKRKLRLLSKKYHPDRNNGNDATMKLLNKVKEELEKGQVPKSFIIKETQESETSFVKKESFQTDPILPIQELEKQIQKLKQIVKETHKRLKNINKALSEYHRQYKQSIDKVEEKKIEIEEKKKKSKSLEKKIFFLLGMLLGSVFLLLVLIIIFGFIYQLFSGIHLIFTSILITIFIIILLQLMINLNKQKQLIDQTIIEDYKEKREYLSKSFQWKDKISIEKKEYNKVLKEYKRQKGDIQHYYYQISKTYNNPTNNQHNNKEIK